MSAVAADGLNSLTEINAFVNDPTPRKTTFSLEGTVLHTYKGFDSTEVILTDPSRTRTEFSIIDPQLQAPSIGDIIQANGIAIIDPNHEHFVRIDDYTSIRHDAAPAPIHIRLGDVNADDLHLAVISTEGVVIDTFPDEVDRRFDILLLKDGNSVIPVAFPHESFGDRRNLIDAQIRITGVFHRFVGGVRKFAWPNIQLHDPRNLTVLMPAPEDPFSVPPLDDRLYLTSDEIARMSKRSVIGEVLAVWSTDQVMLRECTGRILNLTLANGVTPPVCGETIVAAGLPETDLFRINLVSARWKQADAPIPSKADEPVGTLADVSFTTTDGLTSIRGEAYGKLLTLRGIVRTHPSRTEGNRFVLDAGEREIYIDVSSVPTVDDLAIGSEIKVTGRCILLTDEGKRVYASSRVKGLALIARTSDDIVILSRPPWWTPARLLILIALLVLALVGVAAWNLIQKHLAHLKITERTRLAVEIHDSLSQNLAGVACQVSAGNFALDENPKSARKFIAAAEQMLQSCRTELRNCLFDLRSDMLEEPTFKQAIFKALNQLTEETEVMIRFNARRADFSDTAAHAILSVIRELTANAVRHGHATTVRIAGCTDQGKLFFSVSDDGCGFDPKHCAGIPEGHFGLSGIRDRIKRLNGTIDIASTLGKGTKATVIVPMTVA